jgi:ATP-dependent Clp protease adaptor protein ClpS
MSQYPGDQAPIRREGRAEPSPAPPRRSLPRYKVVLLNSAAHELMFIVRAVMELTRLCRAEATHKMWEAHHHGRSVLVVTYRERAELLAEQFADKGLTVVLEPS